MNLGVCEPQLCMRVHVCDCIAPCLGTGLGREGQGT